MCQHTNINISKTFSTSQTTNDKRQTTNNFFNPTKPQTTCVNTPTLTFQKLFQLHKQQTTNNKQQTTNDKKLFQPHQTTNNMCQHTNINISKTFSKK
jgi:hypothetical protein